MKILITIPHYYEPVQNPIHGSGSRRPEQKIRALSECIASLHRNFGHLQQQIQLASRQAIPVNRMNTHDITIIVCTTQERHLLSQLPIPKGLWVHRVTNAEPALVGFECRSVLGENLGGYDYYGYMEDDLILDDSLFFQKLEWLNRAFGNGVLVQPNRFEISTIGGVLKVYIDGDLRPDITGPYRSKDSPRFLKTHFGGKEVVFEHTLNPHSGSYFLNREQMTIWSNQPHFYDRDTSFIGPLESAATLGVLKTFPIYKPVSQMASFLEIRHYGTAFLSLIGKKVKPWNPQNKGSIQ